MTTKLEWTPWAVIAASIALFSWSQPARAQSSNNAFFVGGSTNVVGSALALPVDVSAENRVTEIVITNAGPALYLHVQLIDGGSDEAEEDSEDSDDRNGVWDGPDFSCFVTQNETTLFKFLRVAGETRLKYECTTSSSPDLVPPVPGLPFDDPVELERGIMFVTTERREEWGFMTVDANQLLGDATVIDYDQGVAYSFDAITFKSMANDGNRVYRFDGTEYTPFPAKLATNFKAPMPPTHYGLKATTAELILFTLDGTIGSAPTAKVMGIFYDDDEFRRSFSHTFDCFDILNLGAFDARFMKTNLKSETGHLVLTPLEVGQEDELHDGTMGIGNGNELRKAPVHGWLVQTATLGQQLGDDYRYLAGDAAWGRPLASGPASMVTTGDIPTLNALCDDSPCP